METIEATKLKKCVRSLKERENANKRKRACRKKNYQINKNKFDNEIFDGTIKKCSCCKEEKPKLKKYWARDSMSKDGTRNICKECSKEKLYYRRRGYCEINRSKFDEEIFDNTSKNCGVCNIKKQRSRKYWKRDCHEKDGIYRICKDCINNVLREKKKSDPIFKLRYDINASVTKMLKKNGKNKNGSSVLRHLSYTIKELKTHLERQFAPWMNWDNYGSYDRNKLTWNIDHIYPQSMLPYDSMDHPNFQKCWALQNLRPLSAIDNMIKGNKIILESEA